MKEYSLPKAERLHGDKATSKVFAEGRSAFTHPFRYFWRASDAAAGEAPAVSVLFSVPKRQFKRAVKRNLLKRRMREAYRLNKKAITTAAADKGKHVSIALIYSSKEIYDYNTIENGIRRILVEIGKRL